MIFTIVIDSREQTPWHFDQTLCRSVRGTLRTGDYAVEGDIGFAIERKSMDDFLGTITTGWPRFQRELGRMREAGFSMPIIVEGCLTETFCATDGDLIVPPNTNHPAIPAVLVLKRIGQLYALGASVCLAENAFTASGIAFTILHQRARFLAIGKDNYHDNPDRAL